MKFLHAKWNNLILASYEVNPEVLYPYVPRGTELDAYDGRHYISLVAFMFHDTRVLNLPVPGHIDFEEVNLRFYVKPACDESKRSVVFIREIVPKKAIEVIANHLFHENYVTAKMNHLVSGNHYTYSWEFDGSRNMIGCETNGSFHTPNAHSIDEFITEHYWGYTKANNKTFEYEVKHDQWDVCAVTQAQIEIDFERCYGKEFKFLEGLEPAHICFAKGSDIEVHQARKLVV